MAKTAKKWTNRPPKRRQRPVKIGKMKRLCLSDLTTSTKPYLNTASPKDEVQSFDSLSQYLP